MSAALIVIDMLNPYEHEDTVTARGQDAVEAARG